MSLVSACHPPACRQQSLPLPRFWWTARLRWAALMGSHLHVFFPACAFLSLFLFCRQLYPFLKKKPVPCRPCGHNLKWPHLWSLQALLPARFSFFISSKPNTLSIPALTTLRKRLCCIIVIVFCLFWRYSSHPQPTMMPHNLFLSVVKCRVFGLEDSYNNSIKHVVTCGRKACKELFFKRIKLAAKKKYRKKTRTQEKKTCKCELISAAQRRRAVHQRASATAKILDDRLENGVRTIMILSCEHLMSSYI